MEVHTKKYLEAGSPLVEVLVAFGLASILIPVVIFGFATGTRGQIQQEQRMKAVLLAREAEEATRSIASSGWNMIPALGNYYPVKNGNAWSLSSGTQTIGDFTRTIQIGDVVPVDPSVKKFTVTVSWNNIIPASTISHFYLTRNSNNTFVHTTQPEFDLGVLNGVQVTNVSGGEIVLANNNRAKWCSPEFSIDGHGAEVTISLPDGPPVAVDAYPSATSSAIPNQVFVATSPDATNSAKMAHLSVTADSTPPVPTLKGIFTLDPGAYSSPSYFPGGINLDNNFKTNDIKFYTAASGNMYALISTNLPSRELVVAQVQSGGLDSFQDPTNKIYKYWTYFNTRQYQGDTRSQPNQDQAPFGYGGISVDVHGDRGYLLSSGYLYVFNLANIDSKSPNNGLDMVGCRIQLDGYDCLPGSGVDRKYSAGQTGTSWSDTTSPAHISCADGGNIELYADNHLDIIQVGSNIYVYVAVGAGTNPEFDIVNVTNVPSGSTNPRINSSSCGRIFGGASGWKRISSLDFNSASGTEEAANSVYAKTDGSRAYISSNGGIDGNGDGQPDSHQFYILNTSNKNSPAMIGGGYYDGDSSNIQLFPKRSLTVLNSERAILVGKDGILDGLQPKEYQVLNIENESSPAYCGGLNFLPGFNDLTGVSEADGDNFVYMVANTMEKQLKIIQGGPDDGIYVPSGYYESSVFSETGPLGFNRLVASVSEPASTSVKLQVAVARPGSGMCSDAVYSFVGPGGTAADYFTSVSGVIAGPIPTTESGDFKNPGACFKYKAYLETTDYSQTPVLNDVSVNYSP